MFRFPRTLSGVLLIVAILAPALAQASHFRGGSITWQALDLDNDGQVNDVRLTVKTAWRTDFVESPTANSFVSEPAITFAEVGTGNVTTLSGSPDANGQYALSTNIFEARNLDISTSYEVYYTSCCRINELVNNAGKAWKIQTVINLAGGNLAPKIELPIIFEVPQIRQDGTRLENWTFNTGSTDPNADKLKFRLANLDELGASDAVQPDGFSINPNTGVITWSGSGSLAPGLYSAGIVAEDQDDNGIEKSKSHVDFILYLQNNKATQFNESANVPETRNVIVEKGSTYTFNVNGTAIETTSLGNIQGALTEDASVESQYTFDPVNLAPAAYPITFEVRDTTNTTIKNYLVLNFIVPDPDAPKIVNLEADRTVYGTTDRQIIDAGEDALVTDRNNVDFDGGELKVNVTFTDGLEENLSVRNQGTGAGQIGLSGDTVLYEGNPIGTIDANDNGQGRALRINFAGANATPAAVTALVRNLTYQDTFTLRAPGDRNLSLFIKDKEGKSNSYNFYVDVQDHPSRPASGGPVGSANGMIVAEGSAVALGTENINFSDPDTDRGQIAISVTEVSNGQFENSGNPGVAITSFTQESVDLGQVTFVHDDSEVAPTYSLSASDGTTSTAPSAGDVRFSHINDNAPVISGTPDTEVKVDTPYQFRPTASDEDVGDVLTFSVTNQPSWTTFDASTGELSGTPGNADRGTYASIGITVTDSDGAASSLPAFDIWVFQDSDGDGVPDSTENTDGTDPSDAASYKDGDADGVPDHVETRDGTAINNKSDFLDSDGDNASDYSEARDGTDPNNASDVRDTDGDRVPDDEETRDETDLNDRTSYRDNDGDGVPGVVEMQEGTDPGLAADYLDTDGDGASDYSEGQAGTDPGNTSDVQDTDGDRIPDDQESRDGTSPGDKTSYKDVDGDGVPDRVETAQGTSANDGTDYRDTDNDGTADYVESSLDSTDPNDGSDFRDSDGDRVSDRLETEQGTDPNDKTSYRDTDADQVPDQVEQTESTNINDDADYRDADADGVPDYVETVVDGTDANNQQSFRDTDGDGVPDYQETVTGSDPNDAASYVDTDSDRVPDYVEIIDGTDEMDKRSYADADGDGVPTHVELRVDLTDPDNGSRFLDADGDGVPDYGELYFDGSNASIAESVRDTDGDGVPDFIENQVDGTNPADGSLFLDSDRDGTPDFVEVYVDGTDPLGDSSPPTVSAPPEVTVNATGLYTKISRAQLEALGLASASDSNDGANCCSPYPKSLVDNEPFFPPGRHEIVWAAEDDKGNVGTANQVLNVKPLVSLSKDQVKPEGADVQIKVVLNGPSPFYPVEVPYSVSGSATNPADHNLAGGIAVIDKGLQTTLSFSLTNDAIPEADETIVVTLGEGVNRSPSSRHVLTVSERNISPEVDVVVRQDGEERLVVTRDGGPVVLSALVTDGNRNDSHQFNWNTGILIDRDSASASVTLDPSVMEPGRDYPLTVVVTDNGRPAAEDSTTVHLKVVDVLPALSSVQDSDGDGVPDANEGHGDADQDGIPDYLDSSLYDCSVVPEEVEDYQRFLMESDPGTCIKLGQYSRFATRGGSRLLEESDIGATSITQLPEDPETTNVGGIFDFTVENLASAGQSVRVVVPQRAAIPQNAVYRKYSAEGGWVDFRENAGNSLASAPGEPGFCPTAGSGEYRAGLNPGDWCVQLTMTDGGENDDDGKANGVVVDPGGVAVIAGLENSGTLKTSGGGGAFGPFGLGLLIAAGIAARAARLRAALGAKLKALALPVIAVCVLASSLDIVQAQAANRGVTGERAPPIYLTGSLGYAFTDISHSDIEGRFADRGYQATVHSSDGGRLAGTIGAGYRLTESLALEIAWVDLGDTEITFSSTPVNRDIAAVHPESGQGPAASAIYRYAITDRLGLRARGGVLFWDRDYSTTQGEVAITDDEESGTDFFYGVGIDYRVSRLIFLTAEVQRFEFSRDPSHFVSAGFEFNFPELLK
ncbi:putative Ig domain-containing protein [Marinobacter fonticola]|uniref:putative Ig domain-containing protein n=1 Tax=Marinobacter fonticola TaxID=2603215 RepID=UPI001D0DB065|nr:putative Ig domain-containing protein [Marinobacter fonticola]